MTADTFSTEVSEALRSYDRHVIAIEKTPDEAQSTLQSLVTKAINAFENRDCGLRHGIALDKHLTVILSQRAESATPMCGIYFNLRSPYMGTNKMSERLKMLDAPQAISELEGLKQEAYRALNCLYIAVDKDVAASINEKVRAYQTALEQLYRARGGD